MQNGFNTSVMYKLFLVFIHFYKFNMFFFARTPSMYAHMVFIDRIKLIYENKYNLLMQFTNIISAVLIHW